MININGLNKFRDFFAEYDNNYVLIGGTACAIIFDEIGEPFRATNEISSLSAILLNDDYYQFMLNGKRIIDGISVLDEKYLIPFKAKAWCELIDRKKQGEKGQSRHIKKHCKDIGNLVTLLPSDERLEISGMVKKDMQTFVDDILTSEFVPDNVDGTKLHSVLKKIYL